MLAEETPKLVAKLVTSLLISLRALTVFPVTCDSRTISLSNFIAWSIPSLKAIVSLIKPDAATLKAKNRLPAMPVIRPKPSMALPACVAATLVLSRVAFVFSSLLSSISSLILIGVPLKLFLNRTSVCLTLLTFSCV